ncbi:hypothetical protein KX816_04485 [Sphingosinicellaceae bacterium]|nr:hypothetical protein KX816_04485 [Sphingosinicellaceae bacterium]
MPNIYRPAPRMNGRRRHTLHRVTGDAGPRYVVLDPHGGIAPLAAALITKMREGRLAVATVPVYARGALVFLDDVSHNAMSTAPGAYTPWSPPCDVIELFKDCIRRLGGKLEESTVEPGVYHVTVEEEDDHDGVVAAICGVFHYYDAAVKAGVYEWANPFEIPLEHRVHRSIPGVAGRFTVLPRFRFRMPRAEGSPLRTDPSDRVHDVVPALIAAGAPIAVVMMIKLMIEGLARIAEQIRLNLWDWWNASQFGSLIETTNKGGRGRRTKQQAITSALVAELLHYANNERVLLDRNGWSLDRWRQFLTDPTRSMKERRMAAKKAPLFPARHKGFYSRSGVIDNWYRSAMRVAGLPSRTHYLRHSGVNDFLAYIEARDDLTPEEKRAAKLEFAKSLGWAWPEAMLERYSLPARKAAQLVTATEWLAHRHRQQELIMAGLGRPPRAASLKSTSCDGQLSRLVKYAIDRIAA